ncbi:MAG: hypothetical protein NZL85_10260 [Fimbriimonadales bacterium]|nr:hypothetical protein [Fimbriimonadales bacterium]
MLLLLLGACQSRRVEPVRLDFGRVQASLPVARLSPPAVAVPPPLHASATAALLPEVEFPATPDTLSRRREQVQVALREQREAVRERLQQVRMETLPDLERRWRAELQAEHDPNAVRDAWQTEWHDAFEKHGRQRFPLLAEMALLAPDSERYKALQKQLNELDARWQEQDKALRTQLQERLQRVEQEIEIRLRARRREFIRQVEQEVDQLMRQQPDLSALYLPPPEQREAPPAQLVIPAMNISLESIDLRQKAEQHAQRLHKQTERLLRYLAEEWAQLKGYRLSDSPRARDATDEFLRYLEGRR